MKKIYIQIALFFILSFPIFAFPNGKKEVDKYFEKYERNKWISVKNGFWLDDIKEVNFYGIPENTELYIQIVDGKYSSKYNGFLFPSENIDCTVMFVCSKNKSMCHVFLDSSDIIAQEDSADSIVIIMENITQFISISGLSFKHHFHGGFFTEHSGFSFDTSDFLDFSSFNFDDIQGPITFALVSEKKVLSIFKPNFYNEDTRRIETSLNNVLDYADYGHTNDPIEANSCPNEEILNHFIEEISQLQTLYPIEMTIMGKSEDKEFFVKTKLYGPYPKFE